MDIPSTNAARSSRWRAVASAFTATVVVGADLWLVWKGETSLLGLRALPPALAFMSYALLYRGDWPAIGLRFRPIQGLRYWVMATAAIGAAIGVFLVLAVAAALLTRYPFHLNEIRPDFLPTIFVQMCVLAPIVEEATYRFGLCTGMVPVGQPWVTILVSGVTFGFLHVLYGNPAPDNLIAGFFLAWAYVKSGTIVVPVALHSLGNLFAMLFQLGTWYWRHRSAA
jgi:uncharacterized protein